MFSFNYISITFSPAHHNTVYNPSCILKTGLAFHSYRNDIESILTYDDENIQLNRIPELFFKRLKVLMYALIQFTAQPILSNFFFFFFVKDLFRIQKHIYKTSITINNNLLIVNLIFYLNQLHLLSTI